MKAGIRRGERVKFTIINSTTKQVTGDIRSFRRSLIASLPSVRSTVYFESDPPSEIR